MTKESLIDQATFENLKETLGADFIGELTATYCEETPQLIAKLQQALAQGDAETFRRAAHSIKSSSASLGALDLSNQAKELEMIGKGGDISEAADKVSNLTNAYAQVEQALKRLAAEE